MKRKCAVRPERAENEMAHARTGTTVTMPPREGTSSADTDMDAAVGCALPEWVPAAVVSCRHWIAVFREKPTRGRQRGRNETDAKPLAPPRPALRRVYIARLQVGRHLHPVLLSLEVNAGESLYISCVKAWLGLTTKPTWLD